MRFKFILFVLPFLVFGSCKEEDPVSTNFVELSDDSFLIFGRIEGFCAAPCSYYYAIEETRLLLDMQQYETIYGGPFFVQSNSDFQIVKDLPDSVPSEMILSPDTFYYGNPFIADGTVYKVVYKYNGVEKLWYMNEGDSIPQYAQDFIALMDEKLGLLGR